MIKKITLSLMSFIFAGIVSFTPNRSEAMILVNPLNAVIIIVPAGALFCVILLPFCILDEKAQVSQVSEQDLLNNGYTKEQIKNIEDGQTAVLTYMGTHNMKSADQYHQAVETLKNQLNSDYLEFVATTP